MANYNGTVVSEGGKLKDNSTLKVQEIINKYAFGNESELTVSIENNELHVYGYDSMFAYHADDEERDEEVFDTFINEVSPYLASKLIIKEVGAEKCRYVSAYACIVKPDEKCKYVSLDEAIEKV